MQWTLTYSVPGVDQQEHWEPAW